MSTSPVPPGASQGPRVERAWVLYDVANSAYTLVVTTAIFPLFFKNVAAAGIAGPTSTAWLSYASSAFTLVVAVLAPVLGSLADYEGRKKRMLAGFALLGVLATLLLATVGEGHTLRALVIFALASIGFAGANIFYDSFLTDVSSPARMDRLSTAGFAWGYIGSTVPFMLAMGLIVGAEALGISSMTAVRLAFIITGIWWAVFTVPLLRHVRQRFFQPAAASVVRDAFRRLARVFREIRGYRVVFQFLIAYFFYIDGVATIIKLATAYGTDIGLEANTLLVVVLAVQVVAFPSALLFGRMAARTSAKAMLLFGIAVYVVVTVTAFAIPRLPAASRVPLFWAVAMLAATSQGGIQALSRSVFARLIPPASAAEFFGFYNVFGRFAAILGPILVGGVAQLTGDTSLGVLGIIVLFVIGGGLLLRVPAGAGDAPHGR